MPARVLASLLVAALLAAGPLGVRRGCVECPAGCPMHAQKEPASARKQPGCHRTTERPPAGAVCLRSACGHYVTSDSSAAPALLARPLRVSAPAPGPRIAAPAPVLASLDGPEPPLRPPRDLRA